MIKSKINNKAYYSRYFSSKRIVERFFDLGKIMKLKQEDPKKVKYAAGFERLSNKISSRFKYEIENEFSELQKDLWRFIEESKNASDWEFESAFSDLKADIYSRLKSFDLSYQNSEAHFIEDSYKSIIVLLQKLKRNSFLEQKRFFRDLTSHHVQKVRQNVVASKALRKELMLKSRGPITKYLALSGILESDHQNRFQKEFIAEIHALTRH